MTDIFDQAAEAMRQMPTGEGSSFAQALLTLARRDDGPLDIEPEHLPHVLQGLAQIERGEFATDEEMAEAFRSFEK